MSQKLVLELLRELGGKATTRQIAELAEQRYPNLSLSKYVGNRLRKLSKWGIVKYGDYGKSKNRTWIIID